MSQLKIILSPIILLLIFLLLALTACGSGGEETFATPTATIPLFVAVEEHATVQKPTSTATLLTAEATSTVTLPSATKTALPDKPDTKASPTADATDEAATPTADATDQAATPTAEATDQAATPTAEMADETAPSKEEGATESEAGAATDVTATLEVVEEANPTETIPVATWNPLPTRTPEALPTAIPATVTNTPTSEAGGDALKIAGLINERANTNNDENEPGTPESQETSSYVDRELAIAFNVPADWTIDRQPGSGAVYAPEKLATLKLSVLNEQNNTLELALEEVKQGAFGAYITEVVSVKLGQFDGLRINLAPNDVEGGTSVLWVMITPVGRAIAFIPQGDLTLIEPILSTIRGIR